VHKGQDLRTQIFDKAAITVSAAMER
jgi:hypothetical protein